MGNRRRQDLLLKNAERKRANANVTKKEEFFLRIKYMRKDAVTIAWLDTGIMKDLQKLERTIEQQGPTNNMDMKLIQMERRIKEKLK